MGPALRSVGTETDLELDDMGRGFTTPPNTDSHASGCGHRSDDESLIDENLTHLARRISSQATSYRNYTPCALNPEPGSHLDPNLHTFKPRAWVREFVRLLESDPKAAEPRALSVAFRRWSVFGWTTGTESQSTTLSILKDIAWYLARRLVRNRQGRQVEILRDFEGVVRKGEMLLVLGPPGSGCSTLLKTLSGQTAGLKLSLDSYINFRGRQIRVVASFSELADISFRVSRNRPGPYPLLVKRGGSLQRRTRYSPSTPHCWRDVDVCGSGPFTSPRSRRVQPPKAGRHDPGRHHGHIWSNPYGEHSGWG